MLILRMLSGLAASAWRLMRPRGWGPKKNRVAVARLKFFKPEPFVPVPVQWIVTTTGREFVQNAADGRLGEMWSEKRHADRLRKGAAWHAKAARKAVADLDGEGVLQHMRHFRRYSSGLERGASAKGCSKCGSTCAPRDMVRESWDAILGPFDPVCAPCSGHRDRPLWTARDGRGIPVAEMDDEHLANSARMVKRWLKAGVRAVNDDRIRMCGHVLVECRRRGIMGEVRNG